MTKNKNIPWYYTMYVVIPSIIFLFPVGLFLLWKRITLDNKFSRTLGVWTKNIGLAFIVISILAFLGEVSDGEVTDSPFTVFVLGLVMFLLGKWVMKKAEKKQKYVEIIENNEVTSLYDMATSMNSTYDKVKKDIEKMMDKGQFSGGYVDNNTNSFVYTKVTRTINGEVVNDEPKFKVVKCSGCGATNKIQNGKVTECEYCGSPLK